MLVLFSPVCLLLERNKLPIFYLYNHPIDAFFHPDPLMKNEVQDFLFVMMFQTKTYLAVPIELNSSFVQILPKDKLNRPDTEWY